MTKKLNPVRRTFSAPALPLIALLFATAAALKTGEVIAAFDGETPAAEITAGPSAPRPDTEPISDTNLMPAGEEPAAPDPGVSLGRETGAGYSPETAPTKLMGEACVSEKLMSAIKERSVALDARAAMLAGKSRALEVAEKRVAEEIARLEQNRKSLQRILAEARNESSEDMTRLVQIYANMKPKQASVIFDEMAPRVAAAFIRRMRGNAASFILANMDSKKAYAITLLIAGAEAPFQNN